MILITILLILSLDQVTKFIADKNLSLTQALPVIKGVFHLTLVHNQGAAFGILKGQVLLFVLIAVLAIIVISFALRNNYSRKPPLYNLSLGLILAGALGNLIDRLFFGYVIDFLDFRIWPVFNLADSAITIGAILLGYSCIRLSVK